MRYRSVMVLGGIVLSAATMACSSWQVQQASPELLMEQHPKAVEVHHQDGSKFRLTNPSIVHDTLAGIRSDTSAMIPLSEVSSLGVRRFSLGRTSLLFLSIPAGFVGFVLVGCATSHCGY